MSDFHPKQVRETQEMLERRLGQSPEITRLETGWCLTMRSERVVMTMEYRRVGRSKKWKYHSTLFVDGERRELVRDIDQFVALWNNPDLINEKTPAALDSTRKPFEPPKIGPVPDGMTPPAIVDKQYRDLLRLLPDADVQLGYIEETWQLLVDMTNPSGQRIEMYICFIPFGTGRYGRHSFALSAGVDGKDYTEDCAGDLTTALKTLLGGTPPDKTGHIPIGTPTAAARTNSVEVRRATVIRN